MRAECALPMLKQDMYNRRSGAGESVDMASIDSAQTGPGLILPRMLSSLALLPHQGERIPSQDSFAIRASRIAQQKELHLLRIWKKCSATSDYNRGLAGVLYFRRWVKARPPIMYSRY